MVRRGEKALEALLKIGLARRTAAALAEEKKTKPVPKRDCKKK